MARAARAVATACEVRRASCDGMRGARRDSHLEVEITVDDVAIVNGLHSHHNLCGEEASGVVGEAAVGLNQPLELATLYKLLEEIETLLVLIAVVHVDNERVRHLRAKEESSRDRAMRW